MRQTVLQDWWTRVQLFYYVFFVAVSVQKTQLVLFYIQSVVSVDIDQTQYIFLTCLDLIWMELTEKLTRCSQTLINVQCNKLTQIVNFKATESRITLREHKRPPRHNPAGLILQTEHCCPLVVFLDCFQTGSHPLESNHLFPWVTPCLSKKKTKPMHLKTSWAELKMLW